MPAARPLLLLVLPVLLASPASADVPASSIDALTVTRSGNTITAEGLATIGNASDAEVGTDVTGDPKINSTIVPPVPLTGLGMDLTSAKIRHDVVGDKLVFTLSIADPMDQTFTLPELVAYHWLIKVTNGGSSIFYLLQSMRSGQYDRAVPNPEPLFRVNSCGTLASGAPNCFQTAAFVPGVMANGIVQWQVPVSLIGAFDGAMIEQGEANGVYSVINASGAAFSKGYGDLMEASPYVVGPAVHVGIRKTTQDPTTMKYDTLAALGPDGSFVGKITTPKTAGSYVVSVRACHGDSRGCAVRDSAPIQV